MDLSCKPRTKKLREAEGETVISGTEYALRLRKQLAKLHGAQNWAKPKVADSASDSGEDGVRELLGKGGAVLDKRHSHALRRGTIDIVRCPDANAADPNAAVVQSVRFHPHSSVMLTAGLDKTLRLFNVDGTESSKIQGVHFGDLPIFCAEWSAHGNEIYCSGRRPYFYCYDVGKGSVTKVCVARCFVLPVVCLMFSASDSSYHWPRRQSNTFNFSVPCRQCPCSARCLTPAISAHVRAYSFQEIMGS